MKKYSLLLLPILTGFIFTACDSECCGPVEEKTDPTPVRNVKPTAKINNLGENGILECTPGETVTLTNNSTDPDNNLDNTTVSWEGTINGTNTVACPNPGETTQVCLSVKDTEGESDKTCITLKGKTTPVAQATPPVSIIEVKKIYSDGIDISCEKVHDTDTLHLHPEDAPFLYGSNTPKDIKEVTWVYTYKYADGTIEPGYDKAQKTQTEYNTEQGKDPGYCVKWFHTKDKNGNPIGTIEFEVTALDDDRQTTTVNYIYQVIDEQNGTLLPQ